MALRVFPCTYHCCPLEFCTHLLLNENDTAKWADKTTTGCCLTASHSLIGRAFVVKVIHLFLIKIKIFLLIIRHPLRILLLGPIIKLPRLQICSQLQSEEDPELTFWLLSHFFRTCPLPYFLSNEAQWHKCSFHTCGVMRLVTLRSTLPLGPAHSPACPPAA